MGKIPTFSLFFLATSLSWLDSRVQPYQIIILSIPTLLPQMFPNLQTFSAALRWEFDLPAFREVAAVPEIFLGLFAHHKFSSSSSEVTATVALQSRLFVLKPHSPLYCIVQEELLGFKFKRILKWNSPNGRFDTTEVRLIFMLVAVTSYLQFQW